MPTQKKVDLHDQIYFKNFDIHGKIIYSQVKTELVEVEELEDDRLSKPEFEKQQFLHLIIQDIHGLNFEAKIPMLRFKTCADY